MENYEIVQAPNKEGGMRDIRFRAWDKIRKQMLELDHGDICNCGNGEWELSPIQICVESEAQPNIEDFVLMQYTGLKDKNGKDIYEGDIFQWTNVSQCSCGNKQYEQKCIGYIQMWGAMWCVSKQKLGDEHFEPERLTRWAVSRDEEYNNYYPRDKLYIEIIGNIYENPELLEVK